MGVIAQPVKPSIELKRVRSYTSLVIPIADILALEAAVWLGALLRFLLQPWLPAGIGTDQYLGLCLGVLILPCVYLTAGLYPGYRMGAVQRLRVRIYSTLLVFSILLFWNYTYEHGLWSRGVLFGTMLFALILPPILELITRNTLNKMGLCGTAVLILGATQTGRLLVSKLRKESQLGLIPVAILDDDEDTWGSDIDGVPVVGPISDASEFRRHAELAIVTMPGISRTQLLQVVEKLAFPSVIVVPDLSGLQSLWTVSRDLGGVLGIELRKNLLLRKNRILKRFLDYAIVIPAFVLALPVLTISVIIIKIVSPGPAFFRQEREGSGGRAIRVWKLRTMYPNAEQVLQDYLAKNPEERAIWNRYFKLKKDPRVLPGVGHFLRAASLDELPQLWNVIRGEMSLVGPRPFPRYHLDIFPNDFRELRTSVAPGLTGLWQVSERSDGDVSVQQAHDTYYIRNWSVWLDIYIILRTFRTVLFPKGAY
jgi:Undecaprenyl-phosphate galactose phosphotransferase WbaP